MPSFENLAPELFLSIFRKVQPFSLCRLRQTNKRINDLVERHRFFIQNQPDSEEWILRIQVHGLTIPKLQISVFEGQIDVSNTYLTRFNHKDFHKKGSIIDAYQQLSAFKFNTVVIKFNFRGGKLSELMGTCQERQKKCFQDLMVPMIKSLRLECERLCLENISPAEVCPLIRFNRLNTWSVPVTVDTYKEWPVWKCIEHDIESISLKAPVPLSPVVRHLSTSRLRFTLNSKQFVLPMLRQFLLECRTDRSARGKLEQLFVEASLMPEDHLEKIAGAECLWTGDPYDFSLHQINQNSITISKLPIEGGVAIILKHYCNYHIFFFNKYNRLVLLNLIFPWIFVRVPLDISAVYEDFEACDNDTTALTGLYMSYKEIYTQWQLDYQARLDAMTEEDADREHEEYVRMLTEERADDSDDEDEEWGGSFLFHQFVYL